MAGVKKKETFAHSVLARMTPLIMQNRHAHKIRVVKGYMIYFVTPLDIFVFARLIQFYNKYIQEELIVFTGKINDLRHNIIFKANAIRAF